MSVDLVQGNIYTRDGALTESRNVTTDFDLVIAGTGKLTQQALLSPMNSTTLSTSVTAGTWRSLEGWAGGVRSATMKVEPAGTTLTADNGDFGDFKKSTILVKDNSIDLDFLQSDLRLAGQASLEGEVLTGHGIGVPPTWEANRVIMVAGDFDFAAPPTGRYVTDTVLVANARSNVPVEMLAVTADAFSIAWTGFNGNLDNGTRIIECRAINNTIRMFVQSRKTGVWGVPVETTNGAGAVAGLVAFEFLETINAASAVYDHDAVPLQSNGYQVAVSTSNNPINSPTAEPYIMFYARWSHVSTAVPSTMYGVMEVNYVMVDGSTKAFTRARETNDWGPWLELGVGGAGVIPRGIISTDAWPGHGSITCDGSGAAGFDLTLPAATGSQELSTVGFIKPIAAVYTKMGSAREFAGEPGSLTPLLYQAFQDGFEQQFTPEFTMDVDKVRWAAVYTSASRRLDIRIYEGAGSGGTLIWESLNRVDYPNTNNEHWTMIDVGAGDTSFSVVANQVYTLTINLPDGGSPSTYWTQDVVWPLGEDSTRPDNYNCLFTVEGYSSDAIAQDIVFRAPAGDFVNGILDGTFSASVGFVQIQDTAPGEWTFKAIEPAVSAPPPAPVVIPEMVGATAGADGEAGITPTPLIADKDKVLGADAGWKTLHIIAPQADFNFGAVPENAYVINAVGAGNVKTNVPAGLPTDGSWSIVYTAIDGTVAQGTRTLTYRSPTGDSKVWQQGRTGAGWIAPVELSQISVVIVNSSPIDLTAMPIHGNYIQTIASADAYTNGWPDLPPTADNSMTIEYIGINGSPINGAQTITTRDTNEVIRTWCRAMNAGVWGEPVETTANMVVATRDPVGANVKFNLKFVEATAAQMALIVEVPDTLYITVG